MTPDEPPEPDRPRPRPLSLRELARRFPVSAALAAAILAIYLLELLLGGLFRGPMDMWVIHRLGALRQDLVWERGELFRLLTAAFLHGGPLHIHLIMNGLAFIQIAPLVEHVYGGWRLLLAYLLCALGGSLASSAFMPMPSVGASGALLGMCGLLLGTTWWGHDPWRSDLRQVLGRRLLFSVLLVFALGIGLLFVVPIVDNWGHLGGLVTGLGLSLAYRQPDRRPGALTRVGALGMAALALAAFGWMGAAGGRSAATAEREMIDILVARDPDHPLAAELYAQELVQRHQDQGDLAAALDSARQWLKIAPDNPAARNAVAWYLLVQPAPTQRDARRALWLVEQALEDIEGRPELAALLPAVLDTQAEALLQLGRADEALPVQERAVRLSREQLDRLRWWERAGGAETIHQELVDRLERARAAAGPDGVGAIDTRAGG